jgi:threonine/homoserine/homoserine lactone efflux protein
MSFGLMLGDLTYLTAVVLGLAVVAQTFGMAFLAIKWLGVAYLAFLGWRFWTSGITPETVAAKKGRGGLVSSFIAGLAVTLGNPKTMIFYLAITPTIVDLKTITFADYGVLAALTIVTLLIVLVPYLALAAKARWFLKTPRALKALNRTAAAFMVGAAAAIAARQ